MTSSNIRRDVKVQQRFQAYRLQREYLIFGRRANEGSNNVTRKIMQQAFPRKMFIELSFLFRTCVILLKACVDYAAMIDFLKFFDPHPRSSLRPPLIDSQKNSNQDLFTHDLRYFQYHLSKKRFYFHYRKFSPANE